MFTNGKQNNDKKKNYFTYSLLQIPRCHTCLFLNGFYSLCDERVIALLSCIREIRIEVGNKMRETKNHTPYNVHRFCFVTRIQRELFHRNEKNHQTITKKKKKKKQKITVKNLILDLSILIKNEKETKN